jgi:hypothetical protein
MYSHGIGEQLPKRSLVGLSVDAANALTPAASSSSVNSSAAALLRP